MTTGATPRHATLAIALALAVYATTLLDGVVTDIVATTQSPSAPWPESLWLINALLLPLLPLALVFFYGVLFGGFPLAVLGIVLDTMSRRGGAHWSRIIESQHYACFIAQALSVLLSPFGLLTFAVDRFGSYLGVYVCVQLVAGIVAVFSWRRLLHRASRARLNTHLLRAA